LPCRSDALCKNPAYAEWGIPPNQTCVLRIEWTRTPMFVVAEANMNNSLRAVTTGLAVCLAGMLGWSHRAAGEHVTFHAFGVVEGVTVFNASGFNLNEIAWPQKGAAASGTWTFDPSAPDGGSPPYFGLYRTASPRAVTANIGDYAWHADDSYVAIHDAGEAGGTADLYEAGESRLTLDEPAALGELLDIWIFNVRLEFDADRWSDDLLPVDPLVLAGPTRAVFTMVGDSTQRMDLSPVPLVIISGSLTMPVLSDLDGDSDVDGNDFLVWQRRLGAGSGEVLSSAVPEPMVGTMVAGMLLAGAVFARQWHGR